MQACSQLLQQQSQNYSNHLYIQFLPHSNSLLLIMILRHLTKNYSRLFTPAFLFCSKPPGKGFNKFNRNKSSQPKTSSNSQKQSPSNQKNDPQIKNKDQHIHQSTNNDKTNNTQKEQQPLQHGFSKFARKPKANIARENIKQTEKETKEPQKQAFQSQSDPSKEELEKIKKLLQSLEDENKAKNQKIKEKQSLSKGFSKFSRRPKESGSTQIKQKKSQTETQISKQQLKNQMQKQEKQENAKNASFSGFNRFERKKKAQLKNQEKVQEQKKSKQQPENEQRDNEMEQDQQRQEKNDSMIKGFKKFKKKKSALLQRDQRNRSPKAGKKLQPTNKEREEDEKRIKQEQQHRQMNRRQQIFKMKLQKFKQMQQHQKHTRQSPYFQFRQKIRAEILRLTGIDIDKEPKPPKFLNDFPFLSAMFQQFIKLKYMLIIFLIAILYEKYQTRVFIKEVDPDEFLSILMEQKPDIVKFLTKTEDTENQIGKKKNKIYAEIQIQRNCFRCESNIEFQNYLIKLVNQLNMTSLQKQTIFVRETLEERNMMMTARTFMIMYLLFIFISSIVKSIPGKGKGAPRGGMNANNLMTGQAQSKRFLQPVNVKFSDVMGMQKAKEEVVEFIDFLKNPKKYKKVGAKIPRGALLTGPPGTGKTMIAKACAGESQVPFFSVSGSQFMEMYVGVGAGRVRDLFKQARQSETAIIFIDQIDAIGKKRTTGFGGGNDQRDNTLNQLLVQMDGFSTDSNVIVFAATNQKEVLDPALTRPGRFDRLIEVDLPDLEGRKQIFLVHLKPIVIDSEIQIQQYARRMATLTPGFSGAEIKNLCNQAAIVAARNKRKFVSLFDFQMATQRIIGGVEKKTTLITPETKRTVAYHECGHGVCSWFLEGANPLLKLTIIPRSKGALGFAQYLPHQSQISTKKQLQDQICVILGGRIAEQIFFGKISTGASDDLQKAYRIAKLIVSRYGMSEKLGWLNFEETQYAKIYSHKTEKIIDEEILAIIKKCSERTRQLIIEKKDLIEKLAEKLLEKQTIDQQTISSILGERPFKSSEQYEDYLRENKKMIEQLQKSAFKGWEKVL